MINGAVPNDINKTHHILRHLFLDFTWPWHTCESHGGLDIVDDRHGLLSIVDEDHFVHSTFLCTKKKRLPIYKKGFRVMEKTNNTFFWIIFINKINANN